jgi:hypothetical protein
MNEIKKESKEKYVLTQKMSYEISEPHSLRRHFHRDLQGFGHNPLR